MATSYPSITAICTGTNPNTGTHPFSGRVVLSGEQDAANNQTALSWRFEIYVNNDMYLTNFDYGSSVRVSVIINGATVFSNANYGQTVKRIQMNQRYESSGLGPLVLCSGPTLVPHNSDGRKSVGVSANITIAQSGNYLGTIAPSGTVTLNPITRVGVLTTAPDLTLNSIGTTNHTVQWTTVAGYFYKVQYLYQSTILETSAALVNEETSYTWAVPLSVAQNVTDASTMSVLVALHTYTDQGCSNEIGVSSMTFTITFPNTLKPIIMNYGIIMNDSISMKLVAGITYAEMDGTITYNQGATFKKAYAAYTDSNGNEISQRVESDSLPIVMPPIPAFTDVTRSIGITFSVTDSRGFTTTEAASLSTVYGWIAPTITAMNAVRCNPDGTENLSGSCYKLSFTFSIRSFGGTAADPVNAKSAKISYKYVSDANWTQSASGALSDYSGTLTMGPYALSTAQDEKLEIKLELSDSLSANNPTTMTVTILPAQVFIDILTNGAEKVGLGIGMVSSKQNTIQAAWGWEQYDDNGTLRASLDYINGLRFYDSSGTLTKTYSVT